MKKRTVAQIAADAAKKIKDNPRCFDPWNDEPTRFVSLGKFESLDPCYAKLDPISAIFFPPEGHDGVNDGPDECSVWWEKLDRQLEKRGLSRMGPWDTDEVFATDLSGEG